MKPNSLTKFGWLFLAGILFLTMACTSLLPPNIPLTGVEPTITSLPPFPSATATAGQAAPTAVGAVTVVVTATPAPATATPVPPTATSPAASGCSYQATFLRDVTIPDNSLLPAGSSFVKTWRIRNDGSCAWGPGQTLDRLVFSGGSSLSGPAAVALPQVVQPGTELDISVALVAPAKAGMYVSEWMLSTTGGTIIGVGRNRSNPLTAQIIVGATATPVVDEEPCRYRAAFIADVTFPDNFVVAPGENIVKIWRVRNTGTCVWGANQAPYLLDRLAFSGGFNFVAPASVALPGDGLIMPGETFDISVPMAMPSIPGVYRSEWMFGNSSSTWLGVGPEGTAPLYVQIVVKDTTVPIPANTVTLSFGPGDTQTSFSVLIIPEAPQGYILRVLAGQQMTIVATGGISVGVLDKNLSPLGITNPQPGVWSARIPKTGDYTVVLYGSGDSSVTIKIPPLP